MSKKLIFIIIFLIVILGVTAYVIYQQGSFSGQILSLNITGPATATVGDEITYTINYKNNSSYILQKPELIFDMPDNSLTEDGKTRVTQKLKDIYPGDEESVQIKTILLGKEGDIKTAKASLSYTPQNLTVQYESDSQFSTTIGPVPIVLAFDMPSQLEQGKDLQYSINYSSNVDYPLENVSLKVDPVSGFNIESSSPSSLDNIEWKLPTLNKSQGGKVSITGNVSASASQSLNFSVELGKWQDGNFIVIKQTTTSVQVVQPSLFVSQKVNGLDSYVASAGEVLNYQIFFRNIGSSPYSNLSLSALLDNSNLDLSTLVPGEGGQFQQSSNTIYWNQGQIKELKYLGPQDQGELDFSVKVKNSGVTINDKISISDITQSFSVKVN